MIPKLFTLVYRHFLSYLNLGGEGGYFAYITRRSLSIGQLRVVSLAFGNGENIEFGCILSHNKDYGKLITNRKEAPFMNEWAFVLLFWTGPIGLGFFFIGLGVFYWGRSLYMKSKSERVE